MRVWDELARDGLVSSGVKIGGLTTYKLGGPARYYAEPKNRVELQRLLSATGSAEVEVLIIGRGSNLVVADAGYDGLVIRLAGDFGETLIETSRVTAGAAVSLPVLARAVAKEALTGLEFFVGVPGSVGGAVVMNAGCFGTETSDVLITADIIDLRSAEVRTATRHDLEMRYRSTNVSSNDLVVGASFVVQPGSREESEARMREITRWRKEHQPGGTLNAGSVFKNPEGDAAGRIIDTMGLKGYGSGTVRVSERHANFFVADADASAQDVWDLVRAVQRRVLDVAGIHLEPEIRFAGVFGSSAEEART